jgi:hypothetical protein
VKDVEIMALYDAEIACGGSADAVIVRTVRAAIARAFGEPAAWLYESTEADVTPALLLTRVPQISGAKWVEFALHKAEAA